MKLKHALQLINKVAPVRERGLKFKKTTGDAAEERRSRKGAWIEIKSKSGMKELRVVAPVRERGLKYRQINALHLPAIVAPVRERGLK